MKDKYDVVYIGGDSSGCMINEMFQDGLPKHPKVNKADFETVFGRWGNRPFAPIPIKDILDNITKYDLIFIDSEQIGEEREALFDKLNLWNKVAVVDAKDCQSIRKEYIYKCLVYFKRSWDNTPKQIFRKDDMVKIVPLPYAILDEYYDVIPLDFYSKLHDHKIYSPGGRDIGILCTLPQCYRGVMRDTLVHAVKNYEWGCTSVEHGQHNIQLTLVYTGGWLYSSQAVGFRYGREFPFPEINWWYIYMHFLRRAQTIFTAASHSATCDIRTWESFASGALVFIDFFDVPMPHPFEEGKHYIKIDIKDIPGTLAKAKELLSDNTERQKIAQAGFEHGKQYHTPKVRMDFVFEEIEKRMK